MAKLYGDKDNFRTQKVLVAAKLAKKEVQLSGKTAPSSFPLSVLPALEDGDTHLFGEDAIVKHLLNDSQYIPKNPEVDQWLAWGNQHLWTSVRDYVLPSVSAAKVSPVVVEQARKELLAQLKALNTVLLPKTYLVGQRLSVADVSVALNLLPAYQHVLDSEARKDLVNVTRWFQTVVNNPSVKEIVGEVTLATKASTFDESIYNKLKAAAAPESKKEEKKKDDKKKKNDDEDQDAADEILAAQPKFVDPLSQMPAGTFVMDAFKRVYSNEDTLTKAIPFFWQNFDHEHYSIWFAEYKYPKELTLTFMSCNLISGMFQRLEKLKKHAFASVCLFGSNNDSTISGIWVWRGHDLAFQLSPDWQVDYESYDWKKLDSKDEATHKLVNEYLLWEGDFGGKQFNQGKIFK